MAKRQINISKKVTYVNVDHNKTYFHTEYLINMVACMPVTRLSKQKKFKSERPTHIRMCNVMEKTISEAEE